MALLSDFQVFGTKPGDVHVLGLVATDYEVPVDLKLVRDVQLSGDVDEANFILAVSHWEDAEKKKLLMTTYSLTVDDKQSLVLRDGLTKTRTYEGDKIPWGAPKRRQFSAPTTIKFDGEDGASGSAPVEVTAVDTETIHLGADGGKMTIRVWGFKDFTSVEEDAELLITHDRPDDSAYGALFQATRYAGSGQYPGLIAYYKHNHRLGIKAAWNLNREGDLTLLGSNPESLRVSARPKDAGVALLYDDTATRSECESCEVYLLWSPGQANMWVIRICGAEVSEPELIDTADYEITEVLDFVYDPDTCQAESVVYRAFPPTNTAELECRQYRTEEGWSLPACRGGELESVRSLTEWSLPDGRLVYLGAWSALNTDETMSEYERVWDATISAGHTTPFDCGGAGGTSGARRDWDRSAIFRSLLRHAFASAKKNTVIAKTMVKAVGGVDTLIVRALVP